MVHSWCFCPDLVWEWNSSDSLCRWRPLRSVSSAPVGIRVQPVLQRIITSPELPEIKRLLAHYKLDNLNFTRLHLSLSACVSFGVLPNMWLVYLLYQLHMPDIIIQLLQWWSQKELVHLEILAIFLLTLFKYLPLLIDKVEKMCKENGLRNDSIVMCMTSCPNGCAQPSVAVA